MDRSTSCLATSSVHPVIEIRRPINSCRLSSRFSAKYRTIWARLCEARFPHLKTKAPNENHSNNCIGGGGNINTSELHWGRGGAKLIRQRSEAQWRQDHCNQSLSPKKTVSVYYSYSYSYKWKCHLTLHSLTSLRSIKTTSVLNSTLTRHNYTVTKLVKQFFLTQELLCGPLLLHFWCLSDFLLRRDLQPFHLDWWLVESTERRVAAGRLRSTFCTFGRY